MNSNQTSAAITDSWAKILKIDESGEKQGVILLDNIFALSPDTLQMFSFKDVPNFRESDSYKKHGASIIKYFNMAVLNFEGTAQKIKKLGERHLARNVELPHYDVVGQAFFKTLEVALGDELTPELRGEWE